MTGYIVCPCCDNDNPTLMERLTPPPKDPARYRCVVCSKEFWVKETR